MTLRDGGSSISKYLIPGESIENHQFILVGLQLPVPKLPRQQLIRLNLWREEEIKKKRKKESNIKKESRRNKQRRRESRKPVHTAVN